MDDDNAKAPPHSWKGLLRGLVLVVILAAASVLALMAVLKDRPVDLRERTRSAAEAVDRVLAENDLGPNRTERTEEGQKSDGEAVWYAYRYRIDLPVDKTPESVRSLLETGLASLKVAVGDLPEGKGLLLSMGPPFAEIELLPTAHGAEPVAVAALPEQSPVAPAPETAVSEAVTPVQPQPEPMPESPQTPAPAVEAGEGYSPLIPTKPAPAAMPMPITPPETQPDAQPEPKAAEAAAPLPTGVQPKIAIIVDDGGYGGEVSEAVLALDPRLTLSILPNTPRAADVAQQAAARGFEVMLHMPMEAEEGADKSLSPLTVGMSAEEIRALTEKAIAQVPGAVGVNNHEGSKFTGDATAMAAFLETVKSHSLYFVDSRTSPLTLAASTAQSLGIRTASRDVFLDNEASDATFRVQFASLLAQARKTGSAVGICHFRDSSARVLAPLLNGLAEREGVELVHASELVK